jgi:nicotinate-nucleotide adenylyltransferase
MRIALFGGSFDPPHLGHVLAATYAASVGGADEVWVLPVAEHAYGKALSPWDRRWAMCQAAFAGLAFVRLRDDEQRNVGGYTFRLLESLRRQHPGHTWALVGGTDTAADLHNWFRGDELAAMVEVIAVPRRGYDEHLAALPAISSSDLRARLAQGTSIDGLVPAAVARLIAANGWYR